jgi:hypothetical protein
MEISLLPAWWRNIRRVRSPESIHRSYRVMKSCLETAVVLARAPSRTMLAQEGAGVGMGRLPGRWCPASLPSRPATPEEGEAGGRGESSCSTPRVAPSTPGEGEARGRGEEGCAGGEVVDLLGCWITALLPPPPRLGGGGASSRGGARVRLHATRGEIFTPWWLAAN